MSDVPTSNRHRRRSRAVLPRPARLAGQGAEGRRVGRPARAPGDRPRLAVRRAQLGRDQRQRAARVRRARRRHSSATWSGRCDRDEPPKPSPPTLRLRRAARPDQALEPARAVEEEEQADDHRVGRRPRPHLAHDDPGDDRRRERHGVERLLHVLGAVRDGEARRAHHRRQLDAEDDGADEPGLGAEGEALAATTSPAPGPAMFKKLAEDHQVAKPEELIETAQDIGVRLIPCQMTMDLLGLKQRGPDRRARGADRRRHRDRSRCATPRYRCSSEPPDTLHRRGRATPTRRERTACRSVRPRASG